LVLGILGELARVLAFNNLENYGMHSKLPSWDASASGAAAFSNFSIYIKL